MGNLKVAQPSQYLQPYVKQYWFISADGLINGVQRAIPSGCVGLSFKRGGEIFSTRENCLLSNACIFGQSTAFTNHYFSSFDLIMILFQPLGAKAFFDIPIQEFKNKNLDIRDLNATDIIELEDRLMNCHDNQSCVYWIEQFLLRRLKRFDNESLKRLLPAINLIESNESDLNKLANEACLGYKQFKRIFVENVGLNPKEYIQINRFSKTLSRLQSNPNITLNDLAYCCDYYDKSHLIKDFKTLSGYTPSELILNSDPYSPRMSLFQSFFINIK